jgi:HSP20 family protein
MSLFPRFTQEFTPLFRLLDDYDRATRSNLTGHHSIKAFTPKFDVKEVENAYELYGELPGLERKNINIEWSDSNTLTISGRTESRYESSNVEATEVEEFEKLEAPHNEKSEYHKPTVEEEGDGSSDATKDQTVAKTSQNTEVAKPQETPKHKFWVSERSVGEFHRAFSFPGRINQDGVTANLKNGILSIVVPKAQAPATRRINIE